MKSARMNLETLVCFILSQLTVSSSTWCVLLTSLENLKIKSSYRHGGAVCSQRYRWWWVVMQNQGCQEYQHCERLRNLGKYSEKIPLISQHPKSKLSGCHVNMYYQHRWSTIRYETKQIVRSMSHGIAIVVAKSTPKAVYSCITIWGPSWVAGNWPQGVCFGWKQIRKHNSNHQNEGIQAVLKWPEADG